MTKNSYIYRFTAGGRESFLSLTKAVRQRVRKKLEYFIAHDNPLEFAAKLHYPGQFFRFRIGDYRVIFKLEQDGTIVVILIVRVVHRRNVYE